LWLPDSGGKRQNILTCIPIQQLIRNVQKLLPRSYSSLVGRALLRGIICCEWVVGMVGNVGIGWSRQKTAGLV
jgi:hypothetical protein